VKIEEFETKALRSITRQDFLFSGTKDQDWSNPTVSFKAWRNGILLGFLSLLVITALAVVLRNVAESELGLLIVGGLWLVAYTVMCFIQGYLDDGVFEQQVRYAFQEARNTLTPEEWAKWLGRCFELVEQSPVTIQRMNPWQLWCKNASNPEHFDWILEQLRQLGIFVHTKYKPGERKGANPAIDKRYDDALDRIISKVDGLKKRWMWSVETVHTITLFLAVVGFLGVIGFFYKMFALT
jgi:hypothetical protein